jgi:hypothetical protein
MDLVALLRRQVAALPPGPYRPGLEAVVTHVDCAFRHRQRGIDAADDTLFSDAIYRCNHAFEGGLKEAYRVLANKDPNRVTPYEIETYLEKGAVFRERVLKQLTIYRTEWRNPSTHDYTLDFDQSESLLAIVNVAAFTSMVLDQIAEQLAFEQSKEETDKSGTGQAIRMPAQASLQAHLATLIQEFCRSHIPEGADGAPPTERQLIGALHGFLASTAPNLIVETEPQLAADKPFRPDLVVRLGPESVVVELKRRFHKATYHNAIAQVEHYMLIGGLQNGLLVFMPSTASALSENVVRVEGLNGSILVLSPREA